MGVLIYIHIIPLGCRPEFDKCQRMSVALNAQLLKPRLTCLPNKPPFSHRHCMRMIYNKKADITMLEAGDIYRAGEDYGLIPIMAEVRLLCYENK